MGHRSELCCRTDLLLIMQSQSNNQVGPKVVILVGLCTQVCVQRCNSPTGSCSGLSGLSILQPPSCSCCLLVYSFKLTWHLLTAILSLRSLCVQAQAEEALASIFCACIPLRMKSNPLCWICSSQGKAMITSHETSVFANSKQHLPVCTGSGKGDPEHAPGFSG